LPVGELVNLLGKLLKNLEEVVFGDGFDGRRWGTFGELFNPYRELIQSL
jgi:hypothetical protein